MTGPQNMFLMKYSREYKWIKYNPLYIANNRGVGHFAFFHADFQNGGGLPQVDKSVYECISYTYTPQN